VFHLAAAVSGECEADFDLGMRSNLEATRPAGSLPRPGHTARCLCLPARWPCLATSRAGRCPTRSTDDTLPTPQSSYGIQKFICEQLVADYSRKGFIAGRSVRLMTVSVRPGKPNGAASGFFSGMVREPLAGLRAQVPVPADTPVALASPGNTIAGFVRAAEVSDAQWGPPTAINLPSFRSSVGDMAKALEKVAGRAGHRAAGLDARPGH
jgi:nucleoside-diphosphate-sugar epimerase